MYTEPEPDETAGASPATPDPIENIARGLLAELGEDLEREGLRETPARYARWWREFVNYDAGVTTTSFQAVSSSQLVVVSGVEVWSLCEHHLLPFSCSVTMGYWTADTILGLSKLARIAQRHAHRLQVQERLVSDIAEEIEKLTGSPAVAVLGHGEHLCMTMRGVRAAAQFSTTAWRGRFEEDQGLRNEFFTLAASQRPR